MEEADIVIIGAGVVGLAIGRAVSNGKRRVVILERNGSFGQETSSRNSEVIHSGIYYPTGSLKARLCLEGRRLLYQLCERYHIPCRRTGKLIVAVEDKDREGLERLYSLGKANGVEGLAMLDEPGFSRIEPNIKGLYAIYSPETGIINSHELMAFFLSRAKDRGAVMAFNAEAVSIDKAANGYEISVKNGGETVSIKTKVLINSAGLDSDSVAGMAGIDIDKSRYRLNYCKGQYFRVNGAKSKMVNGLVYTVPKPGAGGLGIHATVDLAGSMRLGPDHEYMKDRVKDYSIDDMRTETFYRTARPFMPFIELKDLSADTSGIRPKLQEDRGEFRDFVIRDEADKGLPGLVDLIGIESPGLTASPAIAEHVSAMAEEILS